MQRALEAHLLERLGLFPPALFAQPFLPVRLVVDLALDLGLVEPVDDDVFARGHHDWGMWRRRVAGVTRALVCMAREKATECTSFHLSCAVAAGQQCESGALRVDRCDDDAPATHLALVVEAYLADSHVA